MIFNDIYKKRGFHETLYTLYSAKNYSLVLPEFFERLEEMGSYYNAFFRVKNDMVKYGILEYKKNRADEKVIGLTPKGVDITRVLKKIDLLVELPFSEYRDRLKKINRQKAARSKKKTSK